MSSFSQGESSLRVIETGFPGLLIAERRPFYDNRGSFHKLFSKAEITGCLAGRNIHQINISHTTEKGTIRGMHFQFPPHSECKAVHCIQGEAYDVAVDLRRCSSSFLKWHSEILCPENGKTFLIPPGFAHGFQALKKDTILVYYHTEEYMPANEGGLNPFDPLIGIEWPLEAGMMSERDTSHAMLTGSFKGLDV